MDQTFILPVTYQGQEMEFEATMQSWAYGYRFLVLVQGTEVIFERDDEGNYRALLSQGTSAKAPENALLEAIVQVIQAL